MALMVAAAARYLAAWKLNVYVRLLLTTSSGIIEALQ